MLIEKLMQMVRMAICSAPFIATRNELTEQEAADLPSVLPLATAQKQTGTIADARKLAQIAAVISWKPKLATIQKRSRVITSHAGVGLSDIARP